MDELDFAINALAAVTKLVKRIKELELIIIEKDNKIRELEIIIQYYEKTRSN